MHLDKRIEAESALSPEPVRAGAGRADARRTAKVVGLLSILVAAVLLGAVTYSGLAMNRAAEHIETAAIGREIDRAVTDVLEEQKSVALWDEAVTRIANHNTGWLDREIGAYLNGSYGHDQVFIVDKHNQPVYAYPRNGKSIAADFASAASQAARLIGTIRDNRPDGMRRHDAVFTATHALPHEIAGARKLRWTAHLMSLNGQPVIMSAMTVVPTTAPVADPRSSPILVSIVRLDQREWSAIGRDAGVSDLAMVPYASAGAGKTAIALNTDDGTQIGVLRWTPHHPGYKQLVYGVPMLVFGTLWALFSTMLLLRRLTRMSRSLEKSEQEAITLSYHDVICDLPNRRAFGERLRHILAAWQRGEGDRPLVAYLDLDRFKDVNDTLGHDTGDALVKSVSDRLQALVPEGYYLARLGGDEFAVAATASDPLAAWKLGRDLCQAFIEPIQAGDHELVIAASIGLAMPSFPHIASAELMRQADIALYRAKEAGGGRAVIFRAEMAETLEQRRRTELDLRSAIARGQLRLVYQPVLTIEGFPQFNSVEALLRWDHPERGMISPDEFIPIAETSGQMGALGEWVLAQALKDSARWPGLQVAVNLSPVQLKSDGFVRRISHMVHSSHALPSQIIIEVTENVMMDASGQAGQALKELRRLGFKIALDDFGTGYSSLSYLRRFQFDRLKIDRSFIDGVEEDDEAVAVVEMVITLGRKLGLEIVAEGIENETQARLMKALGCTHLQGWFVARPIESRDVARMLDAMPRVEPIVEMLRGSAA